MRWTTITSDHLKAAGYGTIVDRAAALAVGGVDPVTEAIANAVARVRRAIAPGNTMDADTTKVPNSFKGVAELLAVFALMQRIGLPLSSDQQQTQRDLTSDLNRTSDERLRVEQPDTPTDTPDMQTTGQQVTATHFPRRQTGRHRTSGL